MSTLVLEAPLTKIGAAARKFLSQPRQLLIDGKWVNASTGKTFHVFDPATGDTIASVADGEAADIDLAVKAARRAFNGPWSKLTPSERGKIIWKIGDLILANLDELAELESLDNGKPLSIAKVADVPLAADLFHYMAGWATKLEGNTIPISVPYAPGAKFFAYTKRDPVGVVGQIIPWNFPLLMAAWKIGPPSPPATPSSSNRPNKLPSPPCASARSRSRPVCLPAFSMSSPATAKPPAAPSPPMTTWTKSPSPARPKSARSSSAPPPEI